MTADTLHPPRAAQASLAQPALARPALVQPAAPPRRASGGPAGEGALARALRWMADHARLAELEPRLLRDVGLTPEDVRRGEPFRPPDRPQRL